MCRRAEGGDRVWVTTTIKMMTTVTMATKMRVRQREWLAWPHQFSELCVEPLYLGLTLSDLSLNLGLLRLDQAAVRQVAR